MQARLHRHPLIICDGLLNLKALINKRYIYIHTHARSMCIIKEGERQLGELEPDYPPSPHSPPPSSPFSLDV